MSQFAWFSGYSEYKTKSLFMNKSSSIMFGGFAVLIIVIAAAAFIRFNYSDSNGGTCGFRVIVNTKLNPYL
jgi:hypothetical protein